MVSLKAFIVHSLAKSKENLPIGEPSGEDKSVVALHFVPKISPYVEWSPS